MTDDDETILELRRLGHMTRHVDHDLGVTWDDGERQPDAVVWCEGSSGHPHPRVPLESFRLEVFISGPGQVEETWSWNPHESGDSEALVPGLREWSQYQFDCPRCPMHVLVKDMSLLHRLFKVCVGAGGVSLALIDAAQKKDAATRHKRL